MPSTWYWWFGDGSFSTNQNPRHTFTKPGIYQVTLVISDKVGNTGFKSEYFQTSPTRAFQQSSIAWNRLFVTDSIANSLERSTAAGSPGYYGTLLPMHENLVGSLKEKAKNREYAVTFREEGLPAGLNWSVILTGVNGTITGNASSANFIRFSGLGGSYTYSVPLVRFGKRTVNVSAIPSSGTVDGSRDTIPIAFSHFEPSWTGYIVASNMSDPGRDVTAVRGSWKVPILTGDHAEMTPVFQWVGIGGFFPGDSANLIQTGTASLIGGMYSLPYTYGWTEILPNTSEMIPPEYMVSPGDTVWADIHDQGSGTWNITLGDPMQNWTYTRIVLYNSSMDSAEWVLENPSYEGEAYELARFNHAGFGSGALPGYSNNATIDMRNGPATEFSGFSITMVNNNSTVARPSRIAPDGSFDLNWYSGNNLVGGV